jgi:hypothetical protein
VHLGDDGKAADWISSLAVDLAVLTGHPARALIDIASIHCALAEVPAYLSEVYWVALSNAE